MKKRGIPQLLLKYLAEVIIIFLGITMSFVFDQWREEKQQQRELIELSESLLADIDALKIKLTEDGKGSRTWIKQLDSLRIQRTSNNISQKQLTWFYKMVTGQFIFLFDPYSPTYMTAASNRIINDLPDSISNKLYKLYRIELPFFQLLYNEQQENITLFRNNIVLNAEVYLYEKNDLQIGPDLTILTREIQQPVYGNFINQVIITEKIVLNMNEDINVSLEALENSLKEYIARLKE